jgi:hypothetical protein
LLTQISIQIDALSTLICNERHSHQLQSQDDDDDGEKKLEDEALQIPADDSQSLQESSLEVDEELHTGIVVTGNFVVVYIKNYLL